MSKSPDGFVAAPRRAASSTFAFTTRRPVAILMCVLAVVVFGWVSYNRLALTLMPDISYPTLTVRTEYEGTAPEEIETLISRPLEQELGIVPKLVTISSISKTGQSDIILEFAWDADMSDVAQDIREKVDRVTLPDAAERPLLLRYDPSLDPILRLGFSGPQSLFELRYIADNEIKRTLEAVTGVAAVRVKGGYEEEFLIAIDERKLALLNLDIQEVATRLAQGNVNLPGGNLREGQTQYLVRTMNEFRTIGEIGELIIRREEGVDVRLKDIAEVTSTHKEREVITRVNGGESIEIEVYKEAGANVVDVAARVREAIFGTEAQQAWVERQKALAQAAKRPATGADAAKPGASIYQQRMLEAQRKREEARMTNFLAYRMPPQARVDVLSDQSIFIEQSIDEVKSNALVGGLIAVAVLYIFLRNLGQTLIIGITIPVSVVATFAPMHMFDVSLNIISLGGLALGVGMLVDNSIVVLESIFRCREEGDDLVTAVIRGTGEVGGAVTASTLTTVAVFFPIVFVEGVAGQIFGDMALTVVFSLVASLIIALFVIPMLASRQWGSMLAAGRQGEVRGGFLRLKELRGDASYAERLVAALAMPVQFVVRVALAVGAVGVLLWRTLVSVVAAPVVLVVIWFERSRSNDRPPAFARLAGWAAGEPAGYFDQVVWPGVTSTSGLRELRNALLGFAGRMRSGSSLVRLGLAVASPVVVVFAVTRCAFALAVRFVGGTLHAGALVLALFPLMASKATALAVSPAIRPVLDVAELGLNALQAFYRKALDWSLANRGAVIGGSFLAFVVVCAVGVPRLGQELIPQVHQGEFNLDLTMPVGTPIERTAEVAAKVEKVVLAQPEVARAATRVGSDQGATSRAEEGEHTGQISVRMRDGTSVETENAVIERIRKEVRDLPELKIELSYPALFTFKAPIEVEVRGYELDTLKRLSREVESRLQAISGLADVRSTLQAGNPELQVVFNRDRLSELGLRLSTVAELLRTKVQGDVATDFRQRERNIDILVRLREEDRLSPRELRNLIINPGDEVAVPLEAVASIRVAEGPSEIRRVDQQRTALITANTDGIDLGTASLLIADALNQIDFPAGFHYLITGQNEEMQTSINSMILALALALFLVYIVMASQFESLLHPFIIMFTVPLALIGVVLVLWLAAIPLSVIVFIGLIMLAGIVVNNAIVLIDFINTLRRSGVELHEAVRQAGAARLRPILMTTLTTVLGLLPMALGLGEGAEIRAPMAITVIVGLVSSTVLTLVVIPTVYVLVENFRPGEKAAVVPAEPKPAARSAGS